jgi:hypothetical protein
MLRDPFTWLISKFFWHSIQKQGGMVCDDVDAATKNDDTPRMSYYDNGNIDGAESVGWAHQSALVFLTYLCGEDCHMNALRGLSSIEQMERQAEFNLRHSIAVVGILEDGEESFFQMVSSRVSYVDMSLNPQMGNSRHSSGKTEEHQRCTHVFQNVSLQQRLIKKSPAIAAVARLYRVGKEVNRFQKRELEGCSSTVPISNSRLPAASPPPPPYQHSSKRTRADADAGAGARLETEQSSGEMQGQRAQQKQNRVKKKKGKGGQGTTETRHKATRRERRRKRRRAKIDPKEGRMR